MKHDEPFTPEAIFIDLQGRRLAKAHFDITFCIIPIH
jgi:hypothetical protein